MNNCLFDSVCVRVRMSEVFQAMRRSGFLDVVDRAMKRLPGSAQCHHHSPSQRPLCLPAFLCFDKVNNKSREKEKVCVYSHNLAKLYASNCKKKTPTEIVIKVGGKNEVAISKMKHAILNLK